MNRITGYINKLWLPLVVVISLACGVMAPPQALAQENAPALDDCAGGTLYYIAFPDTTMNTFDARFPNRLEDKFFLFVYSAVDGNKVKIGRRGGASQNVTVDAGKFESVEVTAGAPIVTTINTAANEVYEVSSDYPIVVYCYMATRFGAEAWTPIPVVSWGTEYYVAGHSGEVVRDVQPGGEFNYQTKPKEGPAEILVIAAYDNTEVTIAPRGALKRCAGCESFVLNAGQAYQVQTTVDTARINAGSIQPDLAGSYISSSKRIGVISGNTRAQLNSGRREALGENSFKNMLIEWIPPLDQHGKEFVYMPTWDARRPTGQPGENYEDKRQGELVRIYGTSGNIALPYNTKASYNDNIGARVPLPPVATGKFAEIEFGVPEAHQFRTDTAAMAMMSSLAVVKFDGTTIYFGNYVGAGFSAWSPYMVEMVSREQWLNFAPFYAPIHPPSMDHFINVVTDTNNRYNVYYKSASSPKQLFNFNHGNIAGTDLIWGSMSVNPGLDYYIEGDSGATFYGFVYGSWKGYELYRPGEVKKKEGDDKPSTASAGDDEDDPDILHPSEYEENVALSYGYPLAPSRCILAPPDEFLIDTVMNCTELTVKIQTLNERPSGIRSVTFEQGSAINAKIVYIMPSSARGFLEAKISEAEFKVVPIDPLQDAEATIIIVDNTKNSKRWKVYYKYEAERVDVSPSDVDFGQVTLNQDSNIETITVTNPLEKDIEIKSLTFVDGTQEFVIVGSTPAVPTTLKPGQSMTIDVRIKPTIENKLYEDTLQIELGCTKPKIYLRAETVSPCLTVNDLNFQTLGVGVSKVLPLEICNKGRGQVTFDNGINDVMTWLDQSNFTLVDPNDLDVLKNTTLGPNECLTIDVQFVSNQTGSYRTVARLWASTRECKDTSIWQAVVVAPGPQLTGYDWQQRWVTNDNECTKNDVPRYESNLYVGNTGSEDIEVQNLELVGPDANAGYFGFVNNPAIAPGTIVRFSDGDSSIVVPVYFKPTLDGRAYTATARITYRVLSTNAIGTVERSLDGVGIESYVEITDYSFSPVLFRGAATPAIDGSVTLTARGTRTANITGISIRGTSGTDYTLNAPPGTPFMLNPDQSVVVPVQFKPSIQGDRVDDVIVEGDFAISGACTQTGLETDSVGAVDGSSYTLAAEAEGYDFGTILTCFTGDGSIVVRNTSSSDVTITNIILPNEQAFEVDQNQIMLPHVIAPNGEWRIDVRFIPTEKKTYTATISFEATGEDESGVIPVAINDIQLVGVGETFNVPAHIDRNFRQYPGLGVTVPLELDGPLDAAMVQSLLININYYPGVILLQNIALGNLLRDKGWVMDIIEQEPGTITVQLTNPNGTLTGIGELLTMDYISFIGDSSATEIPFTIQLPGIPCADVIERDGRVQLDSVCGLNFRLIEAFPAKYSLNEASPNPFNPSTDIEFSIGLDANTKVEIYNATGEKVAVLVDQYLEPGSYTVTWNATSFPSGMYYYTLTSGHWSRTNTMILRK